MAKNSRYLGSYVAALSALVAPVSSEPFFVISGVADKRIVVKKITISGATLTAVAYLPIVATKYSTAPTGGTPSVATKVPIDSFFPASAATLVQGYTAAPTSSGAIGSVAAVRILGQATTAAASGEVEETCISWKDKPVLKSAAENIGVRFTANPATAVTLSITVEWDEESL